ncbi:MAG: type II secretory pathway pseudopilin PulG [Myxococcota bacterium]|jgi:type II secretory pathway pseudopilin PulG
MFAQDTSRAARCGEAGVSLIELLVSMTILMIILTALAGTLVVTLSSVNLTEEELAATQLANELAEGIQSGSFDVVALYVDEMNPSLNTQASEWAVRLDDAGTFEAASIITVVGPVGPREAKYPEPVVNETVGGIDYRMDRYITWVDRDGDGTVETKRLTSFVSWTDRTGGPHELRFDSERVATQAEGASTVAGARVIQFSFSPDPAELHAVTGQLIEPVNIFVRTDRGTIFGQFELSTYDPVLDIFTLEIVPAIGQTFGTNGGYVTWAATLPVSTALSTGDVDVRFTAQDATLSQVASVGTLDTYARSESTPVPINFGAADTFAVLAATTITNTGVSTVAGRVGVSPGTAMTGFQVCGLPPCVSLDGTKHSNDITAHNAAADLARAYHEVAQLSHTVTFGNAQDIGGQTLTPGVYRSASSLFIAQASTLTLDAGGDPEAVFVVQMGSTLVTGAGSEVVLTGGAQACNVFWQVGSSATLGADSTLEGTILAHTSTTMERNATVHGRVLALGAAVTMDTNIVTQPPCASEVAALDPAGAVDITILSVPASLCVTNDAEQVLQSPVTITVRVAGLSLVNGVARVSYPYLSGPQMPSGQADQVANDPMDPTSEDAGSASYTLTIPANDKLFQDASTVLFTVTANRSAVLTSNDMDVATFDAVVTSAC